MNHPCLQCDQSVNSTTEIWCIKCILSNGEKKCSQCGKFEYLQHTGKCFNCEFNEACSKCKRVEYLENSGLCADCDFKDRSYECSNCHNNDILWQDDLCSDCLERIGLIQCYMCTNFVNLHSEEAFYLGDVYCSECIERENFNSSSEEEEECIRCEFKDTVMYSLRS